MTGGEEIDVEVDKDREENLGHFGLVGVAFLTRETQKSSHID